MKRKVEKVDEAGLYVSKNSGKRNPIICLPEFVCPNIKQEYRRFVTNGSAGNGTLTIFDCLKQFSVATSAVLATSYVRAVRIKKIRILAPVTTQGTSVIVRLRPLGSDSSDNNFNSVPESYVDTSASIDVPAYIQLHPSLESPLGSWHQNINVDGNLLTVNSPAGSTLDILFEYILSQDTGISAYSRVVAGATVGTLYAGTILTSFVPVILNTI